MSSILMGGNMSGYFAIPRDIWSSIYKEHKGKGLGTTIALLNVLASRVRYNGNHCDDLKIGQAWMGREEIAKEIGCSVRSVRTSLKMLERLHIIRPAIDQRGTTITILRSDIYSATRPELDQQTTRTRPLTYSTTTTTKDSICVGGAVSPLEYLFSGYPKRIGQQNKPGAFKVLSKLTDAEKVLFQKAVKNYYEHCYGNDLDGTSYVLMFSSFANNRWREWIDVDAPTDYSKKVLW
jgi:hypothetical protein